MFEDDDDEHDLFEDEYYEWRNTYEFWFPKEIVYDDESSLYDFYKTKYNGLISGMIPEMRELMYLHYPETETELRPLIVETLEHRLEAICVKTIIDLFALYYFEQHGFNLKEKYPELEEWARLFATPRVHYKNMNETFENLNLTRAQRRGIMAKLEEDEDFVERKARRRGDFTEMVQKVTFKHFAFLDSLSSDGWIVFSALMHSEFFEYKFHFDILATFIYYKLPEEDIHLTYAELQQKFDALYQASQEKP